MRLAFKPSVADRFGRLVDVLLSNVTGTPSVGKNYTGDLMLLTTSFIASGGDK